MRFRVLTDAWRRSGEGVALVLSAAVDEVLGEGGVALFPVDALGEAAPLLIASDPGVEADVSSACAVYACLLFILARAQELSVVIRVWASKEEDNEEKCVVTDNRMQKQSCSCNFAHQLIAHSRTKSWSKTFLTRLKGKKSQSGGQKRDEFAFYIPWRKQSVKLKRRRRRGSFSKTHG